MSTDALVILKEDHKKIRSLFREFEQTGEKAIVAKGKVVDRIIELLTVHTYLENEILYPEIRRLVPELEADILESYEEHHVADVLVTELTAMKPDQERFAAKSTVLIECVNHHIDEEEQDWFPKVREALGRTELSEIGARMIDLRKSAPRRPSEPGAMKKVADALLN